MTLSQPYSTTIFEIPPMWYFLRAPRRKASGMTFEDQYGSEKAEYFTVWIPPEVEYTVEYSTSC